MLEIRDERDNGITLCRMSGRLDGTTSAPADQHLSRVSGDPATTRLILDLSALDYLSSAGLRVLLTAAKRTRSRSGRIALCSPQPGVRDILEISGFTSIFEIFPTRDAAIAALKS